jgi:ketosteroid isomerase-like protein
MSEENVELIRGVYEDFNSGNIEGVLARYDADIEWVEPGGGNAPSGTFHGPESVGQDVFATVPQNFDEFRAEPEDLRDEGDTVVVTGRFKGKSKSGAELDASFEHITVVRDGKVVRFENKVDSDAWASGWS